MPALARPVIVLHPHDNVAVAAGRLEPDQEIECRGSTLRVLDRIPPGHKVAVAAIRGGEPIRKYGQIIGFAGTDIAAGSHVHVHNVVLEAFARDYAFCSECPPAPPRPEQPATWMGFDRGDGRYGTRNYMAVISTVNCSASTSRYIGEEVRQRDPLHRYANIDGVIAITHKVGCAMAFEGPDHRQLERTLAGFAHQANRHDVQRREHHSSFDHSRWSLPGFRWQWFEKVSIELHSQRGVCAYRSPRCALR